MTAAAGMTSNGIEKPSENPEPLRHLPELRVLREAYCSQQVSDCAIDFLQTNNPVLIQELLVEEDGRRTPDYFNLAYHIFDYLAEEGIEVPPTPLRRIDLICELSRRLRKACFLPDMKPRGKPLVAEPEQPLPPLI